MRTSKLILILSLLLIGFIIVALPDSGPRLFSISREHGPSSQDGIGLMLILGAYAFLVVGAWRNRGKLKPYYHSMFFKTGLFLAGLGLGLVVASVAGDFSAWWVVGVVFLAGVQGGMFYLTLRK